jgi:hypothetical protein
VVNHIVSRSERLQPRVNLNANNEATRKSQRSSNHIRLLIRRLEERHTRGRPRLAWGGKWGGGHTPLLFLRVVGVFDLRHLTLGSYESSSLFGTLPSRSYAHMRSKSAQPLPSTESARDIVEQALRKFNQLS